LSQNVEGRDIKREDSASRFFARPSRGGLSKFAARVTRHTAM